MNIQSEPMNGTNNAGGLLDKLKIEAYKDAEYTQKATYENGVFIVMFNPETYVQKYEVEYEPIQGQGTTGSPQKFGKIKPLEYSFEFLLDGTGIHSEKKNVAAELEKFLVLTTKNDGDIHRPYFLKLSWGNLVSYCVTTSVEITYTLFYPDGRPLRAKVAAVFTENIEDTLRVAEEGNNSPDLTHWRIVKDGDTLPLMTFRIYGDVKYYPEIARINGLSNFRSLEPGTKLKFPPLR
jgi:nucleoid-associated protein YgaU